jgi:hypothetical protein
VILVAAFAGLAAMPAYGQQAQPHPDHTELAKQTQNPVGSLIGIPFQWNGNMNTGENCRVSGPGTVECPPATGSSRTTTVINVEPFVPVGISENWNMIVRWILPITFQPVTDAGHLGGFSDSNLSFYLSPKKAGALIWGAGPSFLIPTATEPQLGTGKWGAGPTVVVLAMPGKWVVGTLLTQIWSFAGDSERESVSSLSWQYFINYNLPKGWTITSSPTMSVNWNAEGGPAWTVPLGGGIAKVTHLGSQHLKLSGQVFGNVARPDGAAGWAWQFTVQPFWPG